MIAIMEEDDYRSQLIANYLRARQLFPLWSRGGRYAWAKIRTNLDIELAKQPGRPLAKVAISSRST
jgi:hypothetical protein